MYHFAFSIAFRSSIKMAVQSLSKVQPNWVAYVFFKEFLILSGRILKFHPNKGPGTCKLGGAYT